MLKSIKKVVSLAVASAVVFCGATNSYALSINSVEAVYTQSGGDITTTEYTIEPEAGYIIVPAKTTVATFLSKITAVGGEVEVFKGTEKVSGTTPVATSMEARLMVQQQAGLPPVLAKTLTIVVLGDVDIDGDGAGRVSSSDALRVLQHSSRNITLTGAQKRAGSISDKSSGPASYDALIILQYSSGSIPKIEQMK